MQTDRTAGASPERRRAVAGFTLVELLVVIAIIALLAGLVTTTIGRVQQRALVGTASANIQSIQIAISAYHQENNVYPGFGASSPTDDPEVLFRALYTGNPRHGGCRARTNYLENWDVKEIGAWPGSYITGQNASYNAPTHDQLDFEDGYTPFVLLDPWGRPFHYIEWDSHGRSVRQLPGGNLRRQGSVPFMIWSDGPNRENDWGEEDDVTSWTAS